MTFTPDVYERIREGCKSSAAAVVPVIYDLVRPASVVDVGGGEGWWARAFLEAGAQRALVLDESAPRATEIPYVDAGVEFAWFDAGQHAPLEEKFDLAICLETGEHVPADTAGYLVELLATAAPVVLWSAAIPGQGGHAHINEQWPAYWIERFAAHGLSCTDWPRWRFWNDETIEPWYRQNLLLFAEVGRLCEILSAESWQLGAMLVVHPDIFGWKL